MDIHRPDLRRRRVRRQVIWTATGLALVAVAATFVLRMRPALPIVDAAVLTDKVKRGSLVRQVRGPGTLVPREDRVRLIAAETEATVARIRVLPGAEVNPDTVLMELVDPALEQQTLDAQLQLKSSQADYANSRAKLQSDMMTQRAGAATVSADQKQAQLQATTDQSLYDLGVISGLSFSASKGRADELTERNDLEQKRLLVNGKTIDTQMAVQAAKVQEAAAILALKQKQQASLRVRAGIAGVLVDLPHQLGEHVMPGITLAKVVQIDQLKASLKIPETQARNVSLGLPAHIDTHNGVIEGHVQRIDPAVQNGTVTVDIAIDGPLPEGARPDLSVDGTIDLDRMVDVLYVDRPALGNENAAVHLFRVSPDGKTATRVPVRMGRASVNNIQVLSGLNVGDTVVISDMSRWDAADHVRLP